MPILQRNTRFALDQLRRKLLLLPIALIAVHGSAFAAEPGTLTSLLAVHHLSNQEANQGLPAIFEATVVYSRNYEGLLFVQDGDAAIFINPPTSASWLPGDRVLIHGKTQGSFRPVVSASEITLLHHGPQVNAPRANWGQLIRAQLDCRLAVVDARVRAADIIVSRASGVGSGRLQLTMDGGHLEANVDSGDQAALKDLLDADIEITGVVAGKFDDKMEQTGIVLYVSSLADIRVLRRETTGAWSLPVMPMDQILGESEMRDLSRRVRVNGTITYYEPGSGAVLQNGTKSLWIATHTRDPLKIGDFADATGFPAAQDRVLTLTDGEIKDSFVQAAVQPHQASWDQLANWNSSKPVGHQFDLVSIDGTVVAAVREASQDEYVLSADGRLFTAIFRHARRSGALPPMRPVETGSRIRVTGICSIPDTHAINPGEDVPFDILLRSYDDIAVLADPSLLNIQNLLVVVGLLLALLFIGGARSWVIERRVRHQNASAAYLERHRAGILEDINGSRPLAEILEHVTELVSFKLRGMPCWIQIADGARVGNCPPNLDGFRVVEQQVHDRSGALLGTIHAGFASSTIKEDQESATLAMAASLATLAIENRRFFSDLLRRSEIDPLTGVHNRFSLEQYLDQLIEATHQAAGMLAVVYIDLNDFKNVNDFYGHLVGDLYLRETASRMKHQLRNHDMLARYGGDEFVVLLPQIHSRAEAEEVAQRLEQTFAEPFALEDSVLHGSASVGIALYPEDGETKDSLLNAADAMMYVAKNARKGSASQPTEPRKLGTLAE
jgi:diguanylate cyclase (GGDEF)-like protein